MLDIKRAPAGWQGGEGANGKTALGDVEPKSILPKPARIGNSPHHGRLLDASYLKGLLIEFDAHHGLHFEDDYWIPPAPLALPERTLWRRARAAVVRWAALLTLKSPIYPPLIGNAIVMTAQSWAVETGHHE